MAKIKLVLPVGLLVPALLLACVCICNLYAQSPEIEGSGTGAEVSIWAMKRWSPYAVGFLIGVLSWLSFALSDKPLGVSTAYARTSGMIEELIEGESVKEREYYRQYVPKIDWEWMLVAGLVIGAFVSAQVSGDFDLRWIPPLWRDSFGSTGIFRWLTALLGGFIMGIGARWAGGCTSGHGISGTLQLAVSSWIALICFFVGGVVSAFMIYS
ncbi:MAG: YeeE/YedE thiosulfate transporter family protein [Thermodesulfobacteriota bacterium]